MDHISDVLEIAGRRHRHFRNTLDKLHDSAFSILSLTRNWKDWETHLQSTRDSIEERAKKLNSIQKSLEERMAKFGAKEEESRLVQESVKERCKELESREKEFDLKLEDFRLVKESIIERYKELKVREKEFDLNQKLAIDRRNKEVAWFKESSKELQLVRDSINKKLEELEVREQQLRLVEKSINKRYKEVQLTADSVNERLKQVESREKEFEMRKALVEEGCTKPELKQFKKCSKDCEVAFGERVKVIEAKEKALEKFCNSLELKEEKQERQFEERLKEFIFKEEELEQRCKRLELKEKEFGERVQEFETKEKQAEESFRVLRLRDVQLEKRLKKFNFKEKQVQEFCEDFKRGLEVKLVSLKKWSKELEYKEGELKEESAKLEEMSKEIELKGKQLEERKRELGLKEKQVEKKIREFELKEKRFGNINNAQMKIEDLETSVNNNDIDCSMDATIRFCVTMDGKDLQIFLNEHWKQHHLMHDEVVSVLKLCTDPAKLVLDAMQGFYAPHLKKGDEEFEESVIRRSCILLLEQLMKISPPIKPHVRKEAMKLAFDWMTKLKADTKHSLEVLGFLQLLASYGLVHAFDSEELLLLLENVAQHSQAPELLRMLGLANNISCFIRTLIQKKQFVEAVRFIYAFELLPEFPPVPLLKRYLKYSKASAKVLYKNGGKTHEVWKESLKIRVAALRTAIQCIEEYKIQDKLFSESLRNRLASLENQNAFKRTSVQAQGSKTQPPYLDEKMSIVPGITPGPKPASTTTAPSFAPKTASTITPSSKTPSQQQSCCKRPWTAVSAEATASALDNSEVKSEPLTNSNSEIVQQQIEKKCDNATNPPTTSSSPATLVDTPIAGCLTSTSMPNSAIGPENNSQQQSQNKRPRIAELREPTTVQPQQPIGPGMIQHGPYLNPSMRHYSLAGCPPKLHVSSYRNVTPLYHWSALD